MREASSTLQRRSIGKPDNVWLESGLYPEYYLNTWHYQTDGWLSEESAKVYETSTETVFVGAALSCAEQTPLSFTESAFLSSKANAHLLPPLVSTPMNRNFGPVNCTGQLACKSWEVHGALRAILPITLIRECYSLPCPRCLACWRS